MFYSSCSITKLKSLSSLFTSQLILNNSTSTQRLNFFEPSRRRSIVGCSLFQKESSVFVIDNNDTNRSRQVLFDTIFLQQTMVCEGGLLTTKRYYGKAEQPGDWYCDKCQSHNFARNLSCFNCKAPLEDNTKRVPRSRQPTAAERSGDWYCPECDARNFARSKACHRCEKPFDISIKRVPPLKEMAGDWYCPECNLHNFASNAFCFGCNTEYQESIERVKESVIHAQTGDWTCPDCDAHNFAKNSKCFACDAPYNANSATRVAKDVKPGDWYCEKCSAHNYPKNRKCFVCDRSNFGAVFRVEKHGETYQEWKARNDAHRQQLEKEMQNRSNQPSPTGRFSSTFPWIR